MISEVVIKIKGLVLIPFITKLFGAFSYGLWAQFEIIQSLITPIIIMGLDSASVLFLSGKSKKEIAGAFYAIMIYVLCVAFLIGGGIIILSSHIATLFFGGEKYTRFVLLSVPAIMLGVILVLIKCYCRVLNEVRVFSVMRVVESLLPLIPLAAVLMLQLDLFILVATQIGSMMIVASIFIVIFMKKMPFRKPDFSVLPGFLKYGVSVMPAGYAMWVLNASDRLLIARMCDIDALGIYSAAYSLGYMVIPFFVMPFRLMYPVKSAELYNQNDLRSIEILHRVMMRQILFFVIPSIAGLSLLGEPIMRIFTTPEFILGGKLIPYITVGYLFHIMSSNFSVNLGLIQKSYLSTMNIIFCSIGNLVLNYLFIPKWGIRGAALATTIAFLSQFIIEMVVSNKLTEIKLSIDYISFVKTGISTIVMSLFIIFIGAGRVINISTLIFLIVGSIIIYLFSQFCIKYFNENEVRYITQKFLNKKML